LQCRQNNSRDSDERRNKAQGACLRIGGVFSYAIEIGRQQFAKNGIGEGMGLTRDLKEGLL